MHCVFMQVIVNIFNCTHNFVLNTVCTITSVNLCKISMDFCFEKQIVRFKLLKTKNESTKLYF